eukprot:CAMPEP_0197190464 /NCGR_PEP_ID=MMETSP1423-20130617/21699_1 /TAXON_ID=476441 /ORGANISM="Pseudo-nitzschia heimii, Strain UNC1101" /LENGTH=272 /DNA_ID=CAMNT_0042642851 /DNA_START=222 /DNA_END=1040 /DNA_ORIENTATION=+
MPSLKNSSSSHTKRRITKTEKIAELQGKLKILRDENRVLKEEVENSKTTEDLSNGSNHRTVSTKERDKLKEALRTLKRVTVKQEVSLATLRQKSKERRQEIEYKDKLIKKLELENEAFRTAHERLRSNPEDDVSALRSELADLQLKLANEENTKAEQFEKLREREAGISSLQAMLADARGRGVSRTPSSDSAALSMMSDSTAGDDVAKLKKDLAKRSEKITNLQYELDICKDEIHDLKQRNQSLNVFPSTPAPGDLDFFEDNGEEEDFWTTF